MTYFSYENKIIRFFNLKTFKVLGAFVFPLFAIKFVFKNSNIDPMILYIFFGLAFVVGFSLLLEALKKPVLAYILVQTIILWIFLDGKISQLVGTSFKLYGGVFALGCSVALYFIFFHFKYLWSNFILFRLLFIFFCLNLFYYLFHHSDFRQWYGDYLDIWLVSPQVKRLNLMNNLSVFSKEFTETKYIGMYLGSFAPLVCVTLGLIPFYKVKTRDDVNDIIIWLIKGFVFLFVLYYISAIFFILTGVSTIGFFRSRLWGDFLGFGHSFAIYLSYYLMLFVGLRIYLNNITNNYRVKIYEIILTVIICITFIFIVLQINKTSMISLSIAFLVFIFFALYSKVNLNIFGNNSNVSKKYSAKEIKIFIFATIIVLLILNIGSLSDFISDFQSNLEHRFSSTSTLHTRVVLWKHYIDYWLENLSVFTFFFGNGIDSSREAAFHVSAMLPEEIKLFNAPQAHIHNLYLDVFYDYGIMALLYFGGIIFIVINNLKIIFWGNENNVTLKLFSILSLSTIALFSVFEMTYVLRIPIAIVFFSSIAILESIKYAYILTENGSTGIIVGKALISRKRIK